MKLDLNKSFPVGKEGKQGPLPKQSEFLRSVLDPNGPKYTLYMGGIGSGKTLIGCITMLTMAVMYKGTYLVCRQFMPELKITTLKTFLEITPKELIAEYRVADGIVKIKCAGGGTSEVIFRQLEEADKLRSLNLSGFYIDESSQVSEEAFMLLQGRLRGSGLRKGFMTTNPNGHDWQYRWFYKQDHLKSDLVKANYRMIKAPSTENVHLPEGYVQSMVDSWSEDRVRREIYGDFDSFSGMVYHEFRRDVHVVKPFVIPEGWTRVIGADHGYRNPAAFIWGAVDHDENIYIYREFYEREWLIEEICQGKEGKPGIVNLTGKEKIEGIYLDPSTRNRRGTTGASDWDAYNENLPGGLTLFLARNDKTAGIDRVKSYLKLDERTKQPKLYIFDTCTNLLEEMTKYRYAEIPANAAGKRAEKEEPVKVDDHALDALRYLIMSRPEAPVSVQDALKGMKYGSIEHSLYKEIQGFKNPMAKDPLDGL